MKKVKKFKKSHLILALMVLALGAAVWLNMRYTATESTTDTSSKYLGQAEYVNATTTVTETESSYFDSLRNDRKKAREEALGILEETLNNADLTTAQKTEAANKSAAIAAAADNEAAIETVLKAKGFLNVVVVIGEDSVSVIVDKTPDIAGVAKIQDAVMAQTNFAAANIKIITAT